MFILLGKANVEPPGVITFFGCCICTRGVLKVVLPGVLNGVGVLDDVVTLGTAPLHGVLKVTSGTTLVLRALAFAANCKVAEVAAMLLKSDFMQQIKTVKLFPERESVHISLKRVLI